MRMRGAVWTAACGALLAAGARGAEEEETSGPSLGASVYTPDFVEITPDLDQAVAKGLEFLRKAQHRNGSWFGRGGAYPMAMTGLAGTAFLAAGRTPGRGRDSALLKKAVDYVLAHQRPDGLYDSGNESSRPMYGHGFAMMFLAQVYGMEVGDEEFRDQLARSLERAVTRSQSAQSMDGGWYYTPNANRHEGSVTSPKRQ